jgi:hypothetical protein
MSKNNKINKCSEVSGILEKVSNPLRVILNLMKLKVLAVLNLRT